MTSTLFDLTGRIGLVTGSSKGIGYAIAEGLAAAGAEVVLNSRNASELEAARSRIAATGAKAHAMAFDVTDRAAVDGAIARIEADIGPIDVLFNNAGIQRRAPIVDFEETVWRELMAANLDSVFLVGQAVAKRMLPRGRGKIVNTCSLMSEVARPTIAPYTASKGAVKMLTKAMCIEWAPHGIQVNGINSRCCTGASIPSAAMRRRAAPVACCTDSVFPATTKPVRSTSSPAAGACA
jgi:gluconate 5-dehydrogenase